MFRDVQQREMDARRRITLVMGGGPQQICKRLAGIDDCLRDFNEEVCSRRRDCQGEIMG